MSLCIGLTGGIASGKSTVARHFQDLGVPLIDADQVARDVVAPGTPGLRDVVQHFGSDCLSKTGELDRHRLREIVFADASLRQTLESLLHPRIRSALQDWRQKLTGSYGLLMAPIMKEAGFDALTDRVLLVDVSRETQKQRLMSRDDINDTLAEQMLNAQSSRESRLAMADDVIDNSGPPEALMDAVAKLHAYYQGLGSQP